MINKIGISEISKIGKAAGINKGESDSDSFKNIISGQIDKLNNSQLKADEMTQALIKGEVDDLHAVMIATEEARLSLDLAIQVRNKVVEAYKEINNMQL